MKHTPILTLAAMAAVLPAVQADLVGVAAPTVAVTTASSRSNCDLMASNTVRAIFKGYRELTTQGMNQESPVTTKVAIFEVLENLAYRQYVRYGDGELNAGDTFSVTLDNQMPGQPAQIIDTIGQMNEGDEAVMKLDHLYLFDTKAGTDPNIRPVSRMALRKAPVAQTDTAAMPTSVAPLTHIPGVNVTAAESSESVHTIIINGQATTVRITKQLNPGSSQMETHMYINGVEVDPQTRQPLTPAAPAATAVPATPLAPAAPSAQNKTAAPAPVQNTDDDTIVETPKPSEAPKISPQESF